MNKYLHTVIYLCTTMPQTVLNDLFYPLVMIFCLSLRSLRRDQFVVVERLDLVQRFLGEFYLGDVSVLHGTYQPITYRQRKILTVVGRGWRFLCHIFHELLFLVAGWRWTLLSNYFSDCGNFFVIMTIRFLKEKKPTKIRLFISTELVICSTEKYQLLSTVHLFLETFWFEEILMKYDSTWGEQWLRW